MWQIGIVDLGLVGHGLAGVVHAYEDFPVTASESQGDSYVTCGTAPTAPTALFFTEDF